ncbi:MAG: carboxypeptidase-like regulatory domain-containing protein [Bacteroidales bacterium]|nr:carboxypeptidase-like regulatory domain-containing protein [Bacteroidales bacterium]
MMKLRPILVFLFQTVLIHPLLSQPANNTLSGYIEDSTSGERLIGATLYDPSTGNNAVSNEYGFFSIRLEGESKKLEISYLGYEAAEYPIPEKKTESVIIKLVPEQQSLDEVVVTAQHDPIKSHSIGINRISMQSIRKIPVIAGEKDLLKAYQLMPGVQGGMEGTAGMVVRGSSPGENLILLDGVPVYNANHLFGFFSVFNTDAINSSTLMKGAPPARYGGRTSSVLDIRMKEGNTQKIKGSFSAGLISARLLVEGPLIKDKTTFLISARRTYLELLGYPYFKWVIKDDAMWAYNFQDINVKINHRINANNRIYFSLYTGNDAYQYTFSEDTETEAGTEHYEEKDAFSWGNLTGTLRWNHQFGPRVFSNTTLLYTRYTFETNTFREDITTTVGDVKTNRYSMGFNSGIEDYGVSYDLDLFPNNMHRIRVGGTAVRHQFKPGVNIYDFRDFSGLLDVDSVNTGRTLTNFEFAAYLEDAIKLGSRFDLYLGLRYAAFLTEDTLYQSPEPRINLQFRFSENSSLEGSWGICSQNLHLLANSSVGFPTDQWVPVTKAVKPSGSIQYSLAYKQKLGPLINVSVECYYKQMTNLLEYKENANLKEYWEDIVVQGQGQAKGLEIMLQKEQGKSTGWIAYTLSKSDRLFDELNYGNSFPYKYDRRHDLKIVFMQEINERLEAGVTWIFTTGNAVTLPIEKVSVLNQEYYLYYPPDYPYYESKNNYRLPNYHRLDFVINYTIQRKKTDHVFSFGLYNTYMHHNALYYTFYNGKLRSHSIIPIFPSFSYTISFK